MPLTSDPMPARIHQVPRGIRTRAERAKPTFGQSVQINVGEAVTAVNSFDAVNIICDRVHNDAESAAHKLFARGS